LNDEKKDKKTDKDFFGDHLKDMIYKRDEILNREEDEKLRKKMRDDVKGKLTMREILYLEQNRHINRLLIMGIINMIKNIRKIFGMLYDIWDYRNDSEIDPELVEYRKNTLKGYNQIKEWLKERKSPWFLFKNIPDVIPKPPEYLKQKWKKAIKNKKEV